MNSIQSIDKDGEISIESGILQNYFNSGSDYVYTKITDNGSGIDEQDLPRIFDPFFTKKASGTGLGLSVSYKIIESHKGNILVSSRVGEGTSFILQLPLDNTAEV
jgi:signal transduction histidine kinase